MAKAERKPDSAERDVLEARIAELEQALAAESNRRSYYENLLTTVNDAVIVLNAQFQIQEWYGGATRMYGWSADEVQGRGLGALLRQRYLDETTSETAFAALNRHQIWSGVVAQTRRDGRELIVDSVVRAIRDTNGVLTGLIGINRDVTERYQAEIALQRSTADLRAFFDSSPQALYLLDRRFRVTAFNRITARDVRRVWKREIAVGDDVFDYISPESRALFGEHFQRCLTGEASQHERHLLQPDGELRWYELSYTPIYAADSNDVIGVAFSGLDITERKRAEMALRAAETRYRMLVEQIPAVTYIVEFGEHNQTTYISPQIKDLTGYTAEEWLADPELAFGRIHHDDYDRALAAFRSGPEDRRALDVEYRMLDRNGQIVWVHNTASQILVSQHERAFSIGIMFDVTARKLVEEERSQFDAKLQQTQKLESLGMLAGGIAHDFNNLLTSILGYADLALLELPGYSPARPLIAEAVNGARRAAELTAQMLAYSGKGHFVVEPLDLSLLIEDISRLLDISISKKCVLKYHLRHDLPAVAADATQVRQIIMNLVINASEAIGERSGVITLTTGAMHCDSEYLAETYLDENLAQGLYVYLEVADNGVGMSEETLARGFEPFFTTKFTGRGLGLAAVLGIVRGHRGALKIYSEPGVGTTFKVLLPATDLGASAFDLSAGMSAEWQGQGLALIVDDEDTVRGLSRHMLERMGFAVLTAGDGYDGVELFRRHAADVQLVLLDMTMPRLDGEQTFREMRRIRPDVRVILTSGYNEQTATSRFAGKGLAAFIQKPYGYEHLRAVVRDVIAGS